MVCILLGLWNLGNKTYFELLGFHALPTFGFGHGSNGRSICRRSLVEGARAGGDDDEAKTHGLSEGGNNHPPE